MSLHKATIAGDKQRLTATHRARGQFATSTYTLDGRSLHLLAGCPAGWLRRGGDEDARISALYEAVWTLIVHPERANAMMAVKPEVTRREVLSCPQCGSVSASKRCKQCDKERCKSEVETRWSRQRPECRAWEDRSEAQGRVLISKADMDRAVASVKVIIDQKQICETLDRSKLGVCVAGHVVTASRKAVRVHEMILGVPHEDAPDSDCIYMLETLVKTAPGSSETIMDWKGDATRGALALDLVNQATGGVRKRVRFLCAGLGLDAEPAFVELSQAAIQAGRRDYEAGAIKFVEGVHEQHWPGHDHDGRGNVAWRIVDNVH